MRVTTEPVVAEAGREVVHKYLLYNGPVKVSQPAPLELTEKRRSRRRRGSSRGHRYHDDLHLNTLTDYHSPGWMGQFAAPST